MRKHLFFGLTAMLFSIAFNTYAQQSNPNNIGSVKGILRDTVHNYNLKSATVSVFKSDSTLVNYQLSNTYGEFIFKNLPLNTKLYVEISHIGYQTTRKNFSISNANTPVDLKTIIIKPTDITLKEVKITVPPISMNGDTLEFNAAAFKLDSNAVVEDLLRKIPNITLWGDGQITVNGREVKTLLVNGKPFFGGDFKTALQNIPKNALDKVQVYNTVLDRTKLQDTTLEVNLKLKKGKELGYFGKIGSGYGSGKRYESDASFNIFSPKMQMAIIGASNNINKIAYDVRTLTANSTFKGVGTNVEYQPDFRTSGDNRTFTGGVNFTYNFIEKPTWQDKKTLSANYYVQRRYNDNLSDNETTTTVNAVNKIREQNTNNSNSTNDNQKFDFNYELSKKKHRLTISQYITQNNGENLSNTERSAYNDQNTLTSTNNSVNKNNFNNKRFNINANYNFMPQNGSFNFKAHRFNGFNLTYALNVFDNDGERDNVTAYRSISTPATNKDFNRKYVTHGNSFNQQINFDLPNLKSILFGKAKLAGIDFSVSNTLNTTVNKDDNFVTDLANNTYSKNNYLSNITQKNTFDDVAGITFSKGFNKSLSNRYYKNLSLSVSAKQRFINQNNTSERAFQNIKRSYNNFVPSANINFYVNQMGEYSRNGSISFNTNINIPDLTQLAPLIDSTNVYALRLGNVNLREEMNRTINFYFSHNDEKSKNTLNYSFNANYNFTQNKVVDSLFIDNQNKRVYYLTNADGYKSFYINGDIRKALKLKTSELKLSLSQSFTATKNPGYLNNVFLFSNNINSNSSFKINYTYKDKFALEGGEAFNYYQSKQAAFNTQYEGKTLTTTLSSSYNITKKFTLNSNISFNNNQSSNAKDVNFNIWNASAVYRFLKGNNAELKFSALDLLHQNTNIINYGSDNSFTIGTQNVLQQYFMTTFSYYPRQFGKKVAKK